MSGPFAKPSARRSHYSSEKSALMRQQHNRCAWCGCRLTKFNATVDHIVSLLFGGNDDFSNMVAACSDCNQERNVVTSWFGLHRSFRAMRHRMRLDVAYDGKLRRTKIRLGRRALRKQVARVRGVIRKYADAERHLLEIRRRLPPPPGYWFLKTTEAAPCS